MVCDFLNKSLISLNNNVQVPSFNGSWNWSECYRGLDEYKSDEELTDVLLFFNYPDALLKFTAACCMIFMIIGIPGNIITIVALSKYRKVRNATAIFIINLSVSDLLYATLIFPIAISMFLNRTWTTGKIMCQLYPIINYGLNATSVYTIVAITLNRYIMVSHPIQYPKLYQTKNLIIMLIAIWVGAFGMGLPMILELWGRYSLDPKVGFCTLIPDKNGHSPKKLLVSMGFIFPSLIMIACYSRIMYLVKKSSSKSNFRVRQPQSSNGQNDSSSRNQEATSTANTQEEDHSDIESNTNMVSKFQKTFKATFRRRPRRLSTLPTRRDKRLRGMIIAIVISFFACHLPIMIVKTTSQAFANGPYGTLMGYTLMFLTVCSNPIIYVVMSKEYRQAYKSVFCFLNKR